MHNVELYHQSNIVHKQVVPEYLKKQIPRMKWKKSNNRIIDIGSGDGSVTKILQTHLPPNSKLLGCDISENMVSFATDHYSNDQISFKLLDIAGDIPEKMKGSFDHLFSFFTINWVQDQKRAFENIFDLLEQDGECFILTLAYTPIFDVYRALEKNSEWNAWIYDVEKYISPQHDSEEPDKEIIKVMENIGFVDVNVECNDKVFVFDDEDMRYNILTAVSPFKIPKEKYNILMKDYLQILNEIENVHKLKTNHSLKDITLHYSLVTIYGRKPLVSENL